MDKWNKIKEIAKKVVDFKFTKYIVVLGITLIVAIVVAVNANSVLIIEATSKENEKAVFISIENEKYFYQEPSSTVYKEIWYVVEGYKDKAAFDNGEAALYNSDTDTESFAKKSSTGTSWNKSVIPYHFSDQTPILSSSLGAEHLVMVGNSRYEATEKTSKAGKKYTEVTPVKAYTWYNISDNLYSKLISYRFSSFIELSKIERDYGTTYFRVLMKKNSTENYFFKDFTI